MYDDFSFAWEDKFHLNKQIVSVIYHSCGTRERVWLLVCFYEDFIQIESIWIKKWLK